MDTTISSSVFLCVVFFSFVVTTNTENSFFIAKQYGNNNYVCVTNTTYALSWINEDISSIIQEDSKYIPPLKENYFTFDITDKLANRTLLQNGWNLINSLNWEFSDVILDERWNDFKVFKTNPISGNKPLQFTEILQISEQNFRIPLSIRLKQEGHIFLCDGSEPSNSNCYWLMLQAFDGKRSAIRKCRKGKIPYINNEYPDGECKKELTNVTHPQFKNYISSNKWTHFILSKNGNLLKFDYMDNNKYINILQLMDIEDSVDITHLIIHSKRFSGLWKIHKFDFLFTKKETEEIQLSQINDSTIPSLCLSMYVMMCFSCKIKLTLVNAKNVIFEETFTSEHKGWNRIKFIADNISTSERKKILISTIGSSPEQFWAISKIRQCQKTEFRMIGLSEKADCQLMSPQGNTISIKDSPLDAPPHYTNCPEDTIGDFCVKCEWTFDSCRQILICNKDYCACSAGYHRRDCYYACGNGLYGHGCRKQCGKCSSETCNIIDGICSSSNSCLENYYGPKCNIPPTPIFANPPMVITVGFTDAVIEVNNFDIEPKALDYGTTQGYIIQYKKIEDISWHNYENQFYFGNAKQIRLSDLQVETKYLVRSVIIMNNKEQIGDHLKTAGFDTKCKEITTENIAVISTNTSANVTLENLLDISCKSHTVSIYELQHCQKSLVAGRFILFDNLRPYTEYTLLVQNLSKKFITTEGVPTEIRELASTDFSSTSIKLIWKQPDRLNGRLKYYVIRYRHENYLGCKSEKLEPTKMPEIHTTNMFALIENLVPFSNYTFFISVTNTKFESLGVIMTISTSSSNEIGTEEIPKIDRTTTDHNAAAIYFSPRNCKRIQGPLFVHALLKCSNEWCLDRRIINNITFTINPFHIFNLVPFSDYSIELNVCRTKNLCKLLDNYGFKTKPTVPPKVRNLIVYTKNASSISIRFEAPYPPNGVLQNYKISYDCRYWYSKKDTVKAEVSRCKLWPQFHCATIKDLTNNQYYTLKISAANLEPSEYGEEATISTYTTIEDSEPPYDIKIEWTQNNDLELEWKHPNKTNGDVKYFEIQLTNNAKNKPTTSKMTITQETYNLTYYFTINGENIEPTTNYTISISANNGKNGKKSHDSSMSPPDLPSLKEDPQVDLSNETITMSISPKKIKGNSENYKLLVVIPDVQSHLNNYPILEEFDLMNARFALECNLKDIIRTGHLQIHIGMTTPLCNDIENDPLKPGTTYNVTLIVINIFKKQSRNRVYSFVYKTKGTSEIIESDTNLLGLVALLFIIPIIALIYMKRSQLRQAINNWCYSTTEEAIQENPVHLSTRTDPIDTQTKKPKLPQKPTNIHSKPIKITDFEKYVKESIANGELERQHSIFPRGPTKPYNYGSMKENKQKNRYNNLIAYDHSRVILQKINEDPYSDYINANYINGYKVPKAYIATQGPKASTLYDFWRMIWQENVANIANLANIYEGGKKKVEKYWPDINETLEFEDITVQYFSHDVYADYVYRVFNMSYRNEKRKVNQLHFSSWPDHGIPLYSQSLVPFLQKILQIPLSSKSPIVIHCSAGVGRTGTILLCDICLRMAARDSKIDVLHQLQLLREQRSNMVDNIEQYKLAHLVILECLTGLHTSIQCNEIEEAVQKLFDDDSLTLQMKYLEDTQWQDQAMKTVAYSGEEVSIVPEKNRFPNIIPEIQGRVFISSYPSNDAKSSYINAVKVDGFRSPNHYIVTQQPMPNTLGDFWRMILEHTTTSTVSIISLNEINAKDKTCCRFWPTSKQPQMEPAPYITLKYTDILSLTNYDIITIHLHNDSNSDVIKTQIIQMKGWKFEMNCPNNIEAFLNFWEEAESVIRGSNPIFLTCYDGVKASGLFLTMTFVIEKMKLEQICDVCQAVRNIRHNRPQFMQELEQFEFVYKAAVVYIKGFKSYANFN